MGIEERRKQGHTKSSCRWMESELKASITLDRCLVIWDGWHPHIIFNHLVRV